MLMNHPKRGDVEISQDIQSDQQVSSEPPAAVASTSPLPEDMGIPLSQPSPSQTPTSLRERALRYLERKRVRQQRAQEHASAQIQALKTSTDTIPTPSPDKSGNGHVYGNSLPENVRTRFIAFPSPSPF